MGDLLNYLVKNWPRFQHYRDRDPPWIKLYRSIITTDRDFMRLPWQARALAPFVWLLAAENEGTVYGPAEKIAEDLRWPVADARDGLKALVEHGFLALAGDLLASSDQNAIGQPAEPAKPPPPDCPHEQIIALYHELLPALPRVRFWTDERRKFLRNRWQEDEKRQDLEWWRRFFAHVAKSPFLTGGDSKWTCDLEWLVRPSNFVKVIEGRYHR